MNLEIVLLSQKSKTAFAVLGFLEGFLFLSILTSLCKLVEWSASEPAIRMFYWKTLAKNLK
jgi:hypothetical protein